MPRWIDQEALEEAVSEAVSQIAEKGYAQIGDVTLDYRMAGGPQEIDPATESERMDQYERQYGWYPEL